MPITDILRGHVAERGNGAQAALADRVGVKEATISRWVNGANIPEERHAAKLAEALGENEDTVLAAITAARKLRQETHAAGRLRAGEPGDADLVGMIRELARRLEGVEHLIGELLRSGGDEGR